MSCTLKSGIWVAGYEALNHCCLSIIDLSEGERNRFSNQGGMIGILCNEVNLLHE
jgi:hypothetical protein